MKDGQPQKYLRPHEAGGDGLIPVSEIQKLIQGRKMQVPPPQEPLPAIKRLFTVKEAAVYLGTTAAAVYMKIWRGIIPALRDGRRVRVERTALEEYVCARMRPYERKNAV